MKFKLTIIIIAILFIFSYCDKKEPPKVYNTKDDYLPCQTFKLYGNGQFEECTLSEDAIIQGLEIKAGSEVAFNEKGRFSRCTLSLDTTIKGIPLKAKSRIMFHDDLKPWMIEVSEDTVIQNIPCKKKTWVSFYESGKLLSATLSKEITAKDRKYEKDTAICLDEKENFIECH